MLSKFSWLPLLFIASHAMAEQIILDKSYFEHIHFRRIQPTVVTFNTDTIHFDVNKSSSFLVLAFDDIKTIGRVSFQWKANGMLNKVSADQEKTRNGDDAWLRVGLIISGQPEFVPEPLLPRWVQQVRKILKHPSDKMIYLIPDARHAPGEIWRSPFSSFIDMVSVESSNINNEWKQVTFEFTLPQQTVGLWIMADGDNTDSIFSSQLRNLKIE